MESSERSDARWTPVRPAFRPPPVRRGRHAGSLVLRDGAEVTLWRALPEDTETVRAFLERLPAEERAAVTRSLRLAVDELAGFLRRLTGPGGGEAFFVREAAPDAGLDGDVIAFGAYRLLPGEDAACLTLAVGPERRGAGLATLLLERLAVLAAARGVEWLQGAGHARDVALARVFGGVDLGVEERREGDLVTWRLRTRARDLGRAGDGLASRVFAASSLYRLFHPRSVAVVGASRDPGSVGYRILLALVEGGFEGPVYPVNPRAEYVASIPAYPDLASIGRPVDLAVVAVPATVVPSVVDACAAAGVRGLVVITAGYAETGDEGRERQRALLEQVRGHGMRMIGPNCLGMMHTDPAVRLNASFAPQMPPRGTVALCSQSGALGVAVIALARRLGLGLSAFVSVGNKADVSGNDLLEYWEEDPDTDVVLFYLESFGRPRRFARIARRVGRTKPIVAVKAGRTEAGSLAATSHTAALTAADTAVDALFRQTGIIRADTLAEMFGVARALTTQPLPRGRRVALVTNAGGPAILCADALEAAGLRVEPLRDATRAALAARLPAAASTRNPVDMIASAGPETYREVVETVLAADEVDALVVLYTPVGMFDVDAIRRAVLAGCAAARAAGGAGKPVLASIVGGEEEVHALRGDDGEVVPAWSFPEEVGRVLGKIAEYAEWRREDPGVFPDLRDQRLGDARAVCREALAARGPGWLSASEVRAVLEAAGLSMAPGGVAASPDEAARIAARVGFPVAVKLASVEIVHKTDLGAVKLGLRSPEAVRAAYAEIERRVREAGRPEAMQGVLVQPMVTGAAEVMIGVEPDPVFGPLIAFGLGGIHVEVLRDAAFRVSPLTDRDAARMVRQIRGFRLLEGYRGHPAADVPALEQALLRISRLVEAVPELGAIDLNPIFALEPGHGYRIVDARIAVRAPGRPE